MQLQTQHRTDLFADSGRRKDDGQVYLGVNVAISRTAGAGGIEIARLVAERSGYRLYDHELLTTIANNEGLPEPLLEAVDERYVGVVEAMMMSFTSHEGRDGGYPRYLRRTFAILARKGHCVIVGRGAAHLMPATNTIRVRLIAHREDRVVRVEKMLNVSKREAEAWVDRTDRQRAEFVRNYFQRDIENPLAYDLLLNSSHFSSEECAEIIVNAAWIREKRLLAS